MGILFNKIFKRNIRRIAGFLFARYFFAKVFLGLAASTLILAAFLNHAFEKFELVTFDQRFKLRFDRPVSSKIVFIEMGDDSIEAIGRWPWTRDYHATLLSILTKYNAKQVIFDIIFDKESSRSQDAVFQEAIKQSGNTYLPYVFQFKKGDIADKSVPDSNVRNIIGPLKGFLDVSKGFGHVNVAPDIDGTIRRVPLVIEYNNTFYPQIAFKAVTEYLGAGEGAVTTVPGKFIIVKGVRGGPIKIPVDKDNQMLVNWAGRWKDTFEHYSYIDIITSYKQVLNNQTPRIDLNKFEDKICIVGLTASGLYDIRPIPLEPSYPVVGINGNIINNILERDFVSRVPEWIDILFIYLMGFLIALLVSKVRFLRGAFYTLIVTIGYIVFSFTVFASLGGWMSIVYPVLAMLISFLGVTLYNEVVLALEKKRYFDLSIRDGLTKLFNIRHFKEILDKEFSLSSGKRAARKLSLIMADVDHFKKFNDTYGHQVGDFVLRRVARMFKAGSRGHDVVARYGGEEFIMMLPGTGLEDARHIAERIRQKIEATSLNRYKETYSVTVSLGVATLGDEKTKEDLIKKVDDALYAAKNSGRNCVRFK